MASLRRIAEQYQASAASQGAAGPGGAALEETAEADDDEAVPELVEAVSHVIPDSETLPVVVKS